MTASAYLAGSILVITSATLLWVAVTDLKEFKIRNELILVLAGLYFLYAVISGYWAQIPWHIGLAVVMLAVMLYYYGQNLMGGGDVKLLAAAFLWTGLRGALPFGILLTIFIGVHLLAAKFGWTKTKKTEKGQRIPLAPSIAVALIGTLAFEYLNPWGDQVAMWVHYLQTLDW